MYLLYSIRLVKIFQLPNGNYYFTHMIYFIDNLVNIRYIAEYCKF